jgi:deoxyribose-phosphate aldolase
MNETTRRFARLIDLSAVQATSTEADIRACAELATRYNIISVHVLPCWTRFSVRYCRNRDGAIS